jgi:chitin disaccharide deacetylase
MWCPPALPRNDRAAGAHFTCDAKALFSRLYSGAAVTISVEWDEETGTIVRSRSGADPDPKSELKPDSQPEPQRQPAIPPDVKSGGKRIWLCADDYGISPSVNNAIRDLIVRGRLNATSVMVAAPGFHRSEAIPLNVLNAGAARVAIGLHLTLTAPFQPMSAGFRPLEAGSFPSLEQMLLRSCLHLLSREALTIEVATQLQAFVDVFGRVPDFVDGHQHVHLFPQVREAVLAVVKEAAPKAWVRQCGSVLPLRRRLADRKALLLDLLSCKFRRRAAKLGVATNTAFAGTYDFAAEKQDFAALFPRFLERLPDGSLVMCHPGQVDAELVRLDPLTDQREREYAYFAGDQFPAALRAHGIALK